MAQAEEETGRAAVCRGMAGGREGRESGGKTAPGTAKFSPAEEKPRLLLHSCCGPCSTAVVERLASDYRLSLFFYNPNITEPEEYQRRLMAQRQFAEAFRVSAEGGGESGETEEIPLVEGAYEPARFLEAVAGLEEEPEGGARCAVCFRLRLAETARQAKAGGYDCFSTTLSVSPHKSFPEIRRIGAELAEKWGVPFLEGDYKKKDGYRRSIALSKEYALYRQNYCGCEFSKKGGR